MNYTYLDKVNIKANSFYFVGGVILQIFIDLQRWISMKKILCSDSLYFIFNPLIYEVFSFAKGSH